MEEKLRGGGVQREMLQLWGGQDNTTASHMWVRGVGEGGGVSSAAGAAHSGIVIRGGGMQLIRLREMDHSLKSSLLGSLDTKHSCCCMAVWDEGIIYKKLFKILLYFILFHKYFYGNRERGNVPVENGTSQLVNLNASSPKSTVLLKVKCFHTVTHTSSQSHKICLWGFFSQVNIQYILIRWKLSIKLSERKRWETRGSSTLAHLCSPDGKTKNFCPKAHVWKMQWCFRAWTFHW